MNMVNCLFIYLFPYAKEKAAENKTEITDVLFPDSPFHSNVTPIIITHFQSFQSLPMLIVESY